MNEQKSNDVSDLFDLMFKREVHVSRMWNKTLAPSGSIYLIVTIKGCDEKYAQAALMSYAYSEDIECVKELTEKLTESLKAKYKL